MIGISALWKRWQVQLLSVAAGACLGCIFRLLVNPIGSNPFLDKHLPMVTITFLAIVPLAIGYLSVSRYLVQTPAEDERWYKWFFLPWASVAVTMLVSLVVKWEGYVCLIFAGPMMLLFLLLGGLCAKAAWVSMEKRSPGTLSAFAVPLCLLILEGYIPAHNEIRTVQTGTLIHAPAAIVWDEIRSVRTIDISELPQSWVGRVGFPRPLAATLSHDGVGGVRNATFTGGLVFTETVFKWDPQQDLAFSIRANTESIPKSTLDEHVTIGGAYFDVLDGEYRLEQRPDGVLLHLSSRERLSTHLNPYAGGWTDAVMHAIQYQILTVIRNRCESKAATRHNS